LLGIGVKLGVEDGVAVNVFVGDELVVTVCVWGPLIRIFVALGTALGVRVLVCADV
jgi:hypothetical protein